MDPASVDTIENVRAYNSQAVENARAEAEELREAIYAADGVSSQGRTVDEIFAQIEKHEDIPTYGASFVNTIGGAQRYLVLIDIVERNYDLAIDRIENAVGILGHVLGAASQDEVGGGKLGEEFGNVLTKSSSAGDVAPFNALVDRPDVTYGTQFLVMAADCLEDIDPASILPGSSWTALEYSPDPLTGVLNAMGRNPEAALEYLAGEGTVDAEGNWVPSEDNKERWANLTTRDWNWNADPIFYAEQHTGADGLTAALGAASAYRNPDPDQPEARPGADAAATYVAGQGIAYFASDSWPKNDFTETMKENLAVLMANSPEEIIATALGADWSKYGDGPHLGTWGVNEGDVSTVIYRLGDSKTAMATLAAGLGDYQHEQFNEEMAATTDAAAELKSQQTQRSATLNYIQNLSQERFDDNAADAQEDAAAAEARNNQIAKTTTAVFNAVATAGIGAVSGGTASALAFGVASAITKPLAEDALANALPVPSADSNQPLNDYQSRLQAQAYADAIELELSQPGDQGIIDQESIDALQGEDWYNPNPEEGRPHIDPSTMSLDQIKSFIAWRFREASSNDILTELENATSSGEDLSDDYKLIYETNKN